MFFFRKARKERRTPHRNRTLRLETLERRELMDGYGMYSRLPSFPTLVAEGEPPASYLTQSSNVLVPGNVRNDSISRLGEIDRFTVQATAGQVFQVATAPGGNLYAHIRVVGPDGKTLVNTASTSALAPQFTATRAGNYTVLVQGKDHRFVGPYRLGLESLSRPSANARQLVAGNVAVGNLTGTVQVDQYAITARAGDLFQVAMSPQSNFNASIRVFEPGGKVLVNTSTSGAVAPQFRADRAGQYIIQVQAHNLTSLGRYSVGIESLARPSNNAKQIAIGSVANGRINAPLQADQYKFTAVAGQRFQVAMAPQGDLNASIRVFEPGGRVLVNTSTSGAVAPQFIANLAGQYIVQVQARNLTSLGNYRVGIESFSRPSPNAVSLPIGTMVNGRLTGTIQADQYKFSARAGQTFQLSLTPQAGFNLMARVFEPGGRLVLNQTSSGPLMPRFTAQTAGQYVLQVEATNGTAQGNYQLQLTSGTGSNNPPSQNPPSSSNTIQVGKIVHGNLPSASSSQTWQFQASRNQVIQFRGIGQFGMFFEIIAPSGNRVQSGNLENHPNALEFRAQEQGNYRIRVGAWRTDATGQYSLGVESLGAASPDAGRITTGSIVSGNFTNRIQVDQYRFNAQRNQIFQVRTELMFHMRMDVFDSSGNRVGVSADGLNQFVATASGEYIIQVSNWGSGSTGRYRVGLESISPASSNSVRTGRHQTRSLQLDYQANSISVSQFTFNTKIGQGFQILRNIEPNIVRIDVFTPSGRRIDPTPDGRFIYSAPESGDYVIQVSRGWHGNFKGNFWLRVV